MSSNVFDLMSQVRIVLGIKNPLKSICPEFQEGLQSELKLTLLIIQLEKLFEF